MPLSRSYRTIFQRPQSHSAAFAPCLADGTLREARGLLCALKVGGGKEAAVVDMQAYPVGLTLAPMTTDEHPAQGAPERALHIDNQRLDQLMRWHGTDENNLPPAHTLQNLSRDTIAALIQLKEARETIEQLRAAMGQAFWATDFRVLHALLLEALGPPPDHDPAHTS